MYKTVIDDYSRIWLFAYRDYRYRLKTKYGRVFISLFRLRTKNRLDVEVIQIFPFFFFFTHSTTLCDKICQCLTPGRWFSRGTLVSSTNKTDRHDITEILLKVASNTIPYPPFFSLILFYIYFHGVYMLS